MDKKQVLVTGATGMLGWVVHRCLEQSNNLEVVGTSRGFALDKNWGLAQFDCHNFESSEVWNREWDYVVNCIGIIKPYCKDDDPKGVQEALSVNAQFPWRLRQKVKEFPTRVIQVATDCVYSGSHGKYDEDARSDALDVYGKTKSLGEVFSSENFLNIRCSIIGPEIKGRLSLLDWLLCQPNGAELQGFTHHDWNGVTTLQFGHLCERIINCEGLFSQLREEHHTHHFLPNRIVNKFELLIAMASVYGKNPKIRPVDNIGPRVDRTLSSKFNIIREVFGTNSIEEALVQSKAFSESFDFYRAP